MLFRMASSGTPVPDSTVSADSAVSPRAAAGYRRLLAAYLAPQWPRVAAMAVLLLAGIGLQLAGPQVVRSFIDSARQGATETALVHAALFFLGVSLAQRVTQVLAAYWSERVAWTATNALRSDLAAHLLGLDPSFYANRTPGELIERVDGDVNALANFFSTFVVQLAGSGLLLLGVLVAVFLANAWLGLGFAVFAVLALGLLGWVRRFGTPHWAADREHSAQHYGFLGEALAATEDVRASGAEAYVLRRFLESIRGWLPVRRRAAAWGQAVMMAAIAAFAVADALAYGVGGALFQAQALSLGTVFAVVAYAAMLADPIETIREQLQDLQRADAAIGRVRALLEARSRLVDGTADLPPGPLAVEVDGVTFNYPDRDEGRKTEDESGRIEGGDSSFVLRPSSLPRPSSRAALHDVSFRIAPGKVLGLLGRTGSGKTTVGRLLFRFYDVQQGAIWLAGVDVRRVRLEALRAQVGLVTQDVQLFEGSLRDNLTFFDRRVPDGRLLAALDLLGLSPWLARLPQGLGTAISGGRLSAGEAQLVALARVCLKDPGLVILDEPSSRLDPATERLLEAALDRLLEGRTAIVIAHRLATLDRADDVLVLEAGRVLEYGTRARLAADPGSVFSRLRRMGGDAEAGAAMGTAGMVGTAIGGVAEEGADATVLEVLA
jgi:ABC-type multidrug transport system fused ATPase/permease subunit